MQPQYITNEIPHGYCHCGCGQKTSVPKRNRKELGHVKGDPLPFVLGHHSRAPVEMRFWRYVAAGSVDECWEWQGATTNGYGTLSVDAQATPAHRVSWEIHFGPITNQLHVLHKCDNRPCVNPHHLFLGTPADNIHDMDAKGRRVTRSNPLKGEASTGAKLTTSNVIAIRELATQGLSQRKIAKQYGMSQQQISDIVRRVCWAHVP